MNLTLSAIRKVIPHFNESTVTESDFWRVCKRRRIIVREMPLIVNGYYERRKGRDFILINSRLRGNGWLHTALHELCHALLHTPMQKDNFVLYRRKCGDPDDPVERFADAFSVIGMMPFRDLIEYAQEDISENPDLIRLCKARISVLADFSL